MMRAFDEFRRRCAMKIKRFSFVSAVVVGMLAIVAASSAQLYGQIRSGNARPHFNRVLAPTEPWSDDCGDPNDPDANHGAIVQCKVRKFVDESCETAKLVSQFDLGVFTTQHIKALRVTCEDATEWVDLADEAEFQAMGTVRDAGAVMEYVGPDREDEFGPGYKPDGDGDGICRPKGKNKDTSSAATAVLVGPPDHERKPNSKYKEWCAEVIGDGIGDDDGFCEERKLDDTSLRQGKWYLEPCVVLSGASVVDGQQENFDTDKLKLVGDFFDDAAEALRLCNTGLQTGFGILQNLQANSSEIAATRDPALCIGLTGGTPSGINRPPFGLLEGLLIGADAAEAAHSTCDSAANQDVLGNNGSGVCVALAIVKGVMLAAWDSTELLDDSITGTYVDNTVQCLEYHHDFIKDKMQAVQNSLDFLVEWRRLHLQVIEIKEKQEFLVTVTEAGRPDHIEYLTVSVSEKDPIVFIEIPVSWTMVEEGSYLVVLDLPQGLNSPSLFNFRVGHTESFADGDGNLQTAEHSGSTIFDRSPQAVMSTGQ
jgi:hypothetical protein